MAAFNFVFLVVLIFILHNVEARDLDAGRECATRIFQNRSNKCCVSVEVQFQGTMNRDKEHNKHVNITQCELIDQFAQMSGIMIDGEINYDRFLKMLQDFLTMNPAIKDATERAQEKCFDGKYEEYFPDDVCKLIKFLACYRAYALMHCPKWSDDPDCNELKNDLQICKKAFD